MTHGVNITNWHGCILLCIHSLTRLISISMHNTPPPRKKIGHPLKMPPFEIICFAASYIRVTMLYSHSLSSYTS